MERDETLRTMRPVIAIDADGTMPGSPAHFMHHTLRPVLKLQNELLLRIFRHYLQKAKGTFWQLPAAKRPEYIAHCIRQDQKLRSMFTGVVVGQFTEDELEEYHRHESELSRRIAELIIQRLTDQVEKLVK